VKLHAAPIGCGNVLWEFIPGGNFGMGEHRSRIMVESLQQGKVGAEFAECPD
jgi:hypothetical protein